MKNALILLAGGSGKRVGDSSKIPKQFINYGSTNFIEYILQNLDEKIFDIILIVCKSNMRKKYLLNLKKKFFFHNIRFTQSGINRQESSKKGILYLVKIKPKNVLIHDVARPLIKNILIKKLIKQLEISISCVPYIKNNDLIKYKYSNHKFNNNLFKQIQTPQAFKYNYILKAHKLNSNFNANDDTILTEKIGVKTKFIKGDKTNIKITYKDDLQIYNLFKNKERRYGIGYDIHRINYNSKKKLLLCGVSINHPPLTGHSDADVGYHAICDSILGSLSMNDLGYYFKNDDIKWKNANSKIFMQFINQKLIEQNYKIINLDVNFICETPPINKYANKMKSNISKIFNLSKRRISIKATTNEKIGLIGNGKGIAAESIILIENV